MISRKKTASTTASSSTCQVRPLSGWTPVRSSSIISTTKKITAAAAVIAVASAVCGSLAFDGLKVSSASAVPAVSTSISSAVMSMVMIFLRISISLNSWLNKRKSVFDMVYFAVINLYYIKSERFINDFINRCIIERCDAYTALLMQIDRFRCCAEAIRRPQLNLTEHDCPIVIEYDIDLSAAHIVVAAKYVPAVFFDISRCDCLAAVAFAACAHSIFFRNVCRWISHGPYVRIASRCIFVP